MLEDVSRLLTSASLANTLMLDLPVGFLLLILYESTLLMNRSVVFRLRLSFPSFVSVD